MDNLFFKSPATIKRMSTMADRSIRLVVDTERELSPAEVAALHLSLMKTGTFGFVFDESQVDDLDRLEVPDEVLESAQKSQSQRLRNVLFLVAQHLKKDPDSYYKEQTEAMINHYKKKLPPRDAAL